MPPHPDRKSDPTSPRRGEVSKWHRFVCRLNATPRGGDTPSRRQLFTSPHRGEVDRQSEATPVG
ncbi:hypothetical protein HNR60_004098 [Rhodopseudomonas rhenobacensis]|uniref:Uncharacterized protein n=1 Tax=Rhodopseudomonas rhenobacensis TaxID=87461 RepID=A0A7W8E0V5_9BRAD|nr:hypothetical protein [Rhodopseudomonas rhenobacensis]